MSNREKEVSVTLIGSKKHISLKWLMENPKLMFLFGLGLGVLIMYSVFLFIGICVVALMVLYAFRDKVSIGKLFQGESIYASREASAPDPHTTKRLPCPECGSYTKHFKRCSHYGETKKA